MVVLHVSLCVCCRAMRVRKTLGGHLHQTGMPAAAGLWALDHRVPKLSVDHAHARAIAQGKAPSIVKCCHCYHRNLMSSMLEAMAN